jgi:hypothetical protein
MFFSDESDLSDELDWSAIRCYLFMVRFGLNGSTVTPQPHCGYALLVVPFDIQPQAVK